MTAVTFQVQHLEHDSSLVSVHEPVGDSLRWSYKATDVGDISYELSLDDDPQISTDSFAPYVQDWRLQISEDGGAFRNIHAGIITNVGLRARSGTISVEGRDWAEFLNQNVWFDFYTTDFDPPDFKSLKAAINNGVADVDYDGNGFYSSDFFYVWSGPDGATQQSIIQDIVQIAKNSDADPNNTVNITTAFHGSGWDSSLTYSIVIQDETTYLDHIKTIAAMGQPYGFDFYMGFGKTLHFFGPRKKVAASPTPIWVLDTDNVVIETVPDFAWVNNGPLATYVMGLGPGSPAIWKLKFDNDSIDLYRKWFRLARVGDLYQRTITDVRYATQGTQLIYPHKDLNLSVYPDRLGGGFDNQIGDVVRFKWPVPPYHTINAFFWIVEQDYHGDEANNWICDLKLQQIYDV